MAQFDTTGYDRHYAGEVKQFDPTQFMSSKKAKIIGRASQFAIVASQLAVDDANIDFTHLNKSSIGVAIGTTMGEPQIMEKVDSQVFPNNKPLDYDLNSSMTYPAGSIARNVAYHFQINGVNTVYSSACAAGNYSIAYGYDMISQGKMDYMLCGGSDALSRIAYTGFGRLFAMAPEKCQPFDKNRKGMMIGEGAGVVFLETLESAQKRGAHIYAEVLGYGMSCDAHHMTNPSAVGVAKGIKKVLAKTNSKVEDIDYICAHGTGTKENDRAESAAIHELFYKAGNKVPVSSIKSMLGHTMGAASALESVACCLMLEHQCIPPTINFTEKDEECNVDCVPNKSRNQKIKIVLNNSQAFGGNNACIILNRLNRSRKS